MGGEIRPPAHWTVQTKPGTTIDTTTACLSSKYPEVQMLNSMLYVSYLRKLSHIHRTKIHRTSQNFHLTWTSKILNSLLPIFVKLKQDYAVVPQNTNWRRRKQKNKTPTFPTQKGTKKPLFNNIYCLMLWEYIYTYILYICMCACVYIYVCVHAYIYIVFTNHKSSQLQELVNLLQIKVHENIMKLSKFC